MSKVLLVTGGSRGIGAATAVLAAKQGYAVAINYHSDVARAEAVVAEITAAGGTATCMQADVSKPDQISTLFDHAEHKLGRVSAVVQSAGMTGPSSPLVDTSIDVIRTTIDTNLLGTICVAREAVMRMSTRLGGAGGVIVNVASRASEIGSPQEFVWYAASKGGVDSFTVGLGREVALEGIRVVGIAPGLTVTELHARSTKEPGRVERMAPLIPMQRGGTADEVAQAILFALSDAASYITATTISVSGGR